MKYLVFILLILRLHAPSESVKITDLGKSALDIATGVIEKIPDSIPSPENLFQFGKNVLAGYPFDMVRSSKLNFFELNISDDFFFYSFLGQVFSVINSFCKRNRVIFNLVILVIL